ncbi:hypothetical protein R1sor_018294 [Riccia sorocarpa]|uniref:Transposase n=1 Tax=Riccia sorocarpa TaxID=122646 RepID=A0ABD3IDD0_9MARC
MQHVEAKYECMSNNPRDVRLGLATGGFPVGLSRKSYLIWLVKVINYNIPPWHTTKKGHMLLSLVIPGPKKPAIMDIYLEPLVEELKLLWEGVHVYDASSRCPREDRWFILHVICMWTIHDSPGLGFISGLAVSSTKGCPTCGPHLEAKYSTSLRSMYYQRHEKYLHLDHSLRDDCIDPVSPNMTMIDYLVLEAEIEAGDVPRASLGLNQISILMELPYWDGLLIQHLEDAMHEEARPTCKCPTGYGSNFRMAFTHDDTWTWGKGLKTHDLHKLLQDIISIVMVDLGNDRLRKAIWALSKLLLWVCNKEILAEAMFYRSETLARLDASAPLNSLVDKEDERDVDEVTYGKKTKRKLDKVMFTQAHTFILHNAKCMQSFFQEYESEKVTTCNRRERYTRTFLEYMRDITAGVGSDGVSQDVKNIVLGPYPVAKSYNTIWSTWRRFRRANLHLQSTRT